MFFFYDFRVMVNGRNSGSGTEPRLDFRRFLESGLRSPREGSFGGERGLNSRTAAGSRA